MNDGHGPPAAIDVEALYARYAPMVFRRCKALLGHEQEAEDLLQDVFVNVLRALPRLSDRGLSSLMYTTATRLCLNRLAKHGRKYEVSQGDDIDRFAVLDEPAPSWLRVYAHQVLGTVETSTRVMAVLHFVDGMTLQQVADATGMSVSGVRKRLRQLKARAETLETTPGPRQQGGQDD